MNKGEVEAVIDERLKSTLAEHQKSMLGDMEKLLDKISDNSSFQQLVKISDILNGIPKFKRKTNEYQFKHNTKMNASIETADQNLQNNKIQESRAKLKEAADLIAHCQKLIQMADGSSLGWRYVERNERNPLAEGSDDEKWMLKSESRAQCKVKEERAKRMGGRRLRPYGRRSRVTPSATVTTPSAATLGFSVAQQLVRERVPPGVGLPGHWRGSPHCSGSSSRTNNKSSLPIIPNNNTVQNDTEKNVPEYEQT